MADVPFLEQARGKCATVLGVAPAKVIELNSVEGNLQTIAKSVYAYEPYPGVCPASNSRQPLMVGQKRQFTFSLVQGQYARAAIAFSSLPTALDTPTADLDLIVGELRPDGTIQRIAAWSAFNESTVGMVEFEAEHAGVYGLFLSTYSCSQPPCYVGSALWTGPWLR